MGVLFFSLFLADVSLVQAFPGIDMTERVSVASDGTQGNEYSDRPAISADGNFIAFLSNADNLVPNDTNGKTDVFIYNRQTGVTERVSIADVSLGGAQGNADAYPFHVALSADGRLVVFGSEANNLTSDGIGGIFVHDRSTKTTELIAGWPTSWGGETEPVISANGRFVAYKSGSGVYLYDRDTDLIEYISVDSDEKPIPTNGQPSISADGRYVAFHQGDEGTWVRDRQAGNTELVTRAIDGGLANSSSELPSISGDGRFVAFHSWATNLVENDTNGQADIFVRDMQEGKTERVSIARDGTQANSGSYYPSISANGRFVVFVSIASNLAIGVSNGMQHVFIHDRQTHITELVSMARDGAQGNDGSQVCPSVSADGRFVVFGSYATNLVLGDTNGKRDVFIHDRMLLPKVIDTNLKTILEEGITNLTITFQKSIFNPSGDSLSNDVTNPANYLMVESGTNGNFDTVSCVIGHMKDDVQVIVNSVTYNNISYTATVQINNSVQLSKGNYRLFICGTTSIEDLGGNKINRGLRDYSIGFQVLNSPPSPEKPSDVTSLPVTGFAPNRVMKLPKQPSIKDYSSTDLILEIPKLGKKMNIVGVPLIENNWDVTWLGKNAGWLSGTAFPTLTGNTVITGHVWDAYNQPGVFYELKKLKYGDWIKIYAWGQEYTYEVRDNELVDPNNVKFALKHEELDWVTLVTCEDYNSLFMNYSYRRLVRAVLVSVGIK
jgi:LPXTG-site transpeptidase (sortase) family protein